MRRSAMITRNALRVALLAVVALALLTYAILKLGQAARLFTRRYTLYAFIPNASGLREGGQVSVAGQLAGSISKIEFLPIDNDTTRNLKITVQLDERLQQQVRLDSRVMLRNQGLLGDRFFDITPGTPRYRALRDRDTLVMGPTTDYDMMIQRAAAVLTDVAGLTHDLRGVTQSIARGDGTVGKLLTDRELYDRLNRTLASTSNLLARLQNPNGSMGRLLDDPQLYTGLTGMVAQVDSLMTRLNSGQGSAGKFLRDDSLYSNLVIVTARADSLVGSLRNGSGTAARILSDTTLYNQMVQAVGHLNEILSDIRKNPKRYTKGAIKIF